MDSSSSLAAGFDRLQLAERDQALTELPDCMDISQPPITDPMKHPKDAVEDPTDGRRMEDRGGEDEENR
jgi:hypothetical protein